MLWVTLLFAAVLGINRLFVAEHEQGGFDGFLLAPVDRTALFVAKALALFAFLVVGRARRGARLRGAAARARPGRALPGCVARPAARRRRASRSSGRSSPRSPSRPARATCIGPLLALPLLVPVVLAAARGDGAAARGRAARRRCRRAGWRSSALYDLVFGLVAYAVFDFLLED